MQKEILSFQTIQNIQKNICKNQEQFQNNFKQFGWVLDVD